MAKSPEQMMNNYRTGTEIGAQKWNASKGRIVARWADRLGQSGFTVGPITRGKMEARIASAQYRAGDPAYWLQRTREGLAI